MPPSERLVGLSLALEEALAREAWEEADGLFEARAEALACVPPHAFPREVDEIDARILARLQRAQGEIRREIAAIGQARRVAAVYAKAA